MSRLIDADALKKEILETYEYEYPTASGAFDEFASRIVPNIISNAPTVDAVPTDFHDQCMQAEIQKRIKLEKIAMKLCGGYLDMPCGCDGCPLIDTIEEDDEGNCVCDLDRS